MAYFSHSTPSVGSNNSFQYQNAEKYLFSITLLFDSNYHKSQQADAINFDFLFLPHN